MVLGEREVSYVRYVSKIVKIRGQELTFNVRSKKQV